MSKHSRTLWDRNTRSAQDPARVPWPEHTHDPTVNKQMSGNQIPAVEAQALSFSVDAKQLLDKVDLRADSGQFVGLIGPHAVRLVFGADHLLLLIASGMVGGIFLMLADTVARTLLSPTEIPVGVVTALVGGPVFLYLLVRQRRRIVA